MFQTFSGASRDRKAFRPRQEMSAVAASSSQLEKQIENEAKKYGDIIQVLNKLAIKTYPVHLGTIQP